MLINWKFHDDSMKKHRDYRFDCHFVIYVNEEFKAEIVEQIIVQAKKTKKIVAVIKKTIEQEIVVTNASKSKIIVVDIDFFDFTMQLNFWKKNRISVINAHFLHHLIEFVVKYQKNDILTFFFNVFAISLANDSKIKSNSFHWIRSKSS